MLEDERSLGLQVLVEAHAGSSAPEQPVQLRLSPFERLAPQIVTVQLKDIEGVHEDTVVVAPVTDVAVSALKSGGISGDFGAMSCASIPCWGVLRGLQP